MVYPMTMKDGPPMLTDLVRRVLFALYKRKWIYDPRDFALTQGTLTVRAVSCQPFLSKDVAPLDLHFTDKILSLQIVYVKTCPVFMINNNILVFPLNCKENQQNSFKQTCRFYCKKGYSLVRSEYRVCLSSGTWSGEQATCVKCSSALLSLNYGRLLPTICLNDSSSKGVPLLQSTSIILRLIIVSLGLISVNARKIALEKTTGQYLKMNVPCWLSHYSEPFHLPNASQKIQSKTSLGHSHAWTGVRYQVPQLLHATKLKGDHAGRYCTVVVLF